MAAGKNKYRVLVADAGDKFSSFLSELLPKSDYEIVTKVESAGQVRRIILEQSIDLVLLNAPLQEEFGTQLALDLADENMGVMLLVPGDSFEQVITRVEDFGVLTLPKPVTKDGFYRAVKLLTALRAKLLQMERKQQALKEKMQDIRIVNQAKWLLIEKLNMSENDAHYFIEKKAMDLRLSRREVAQTVIENYQK